MAEDLFKLAKKYISQEEVLKEYDMIDEELKDLRKRKIKKILEQRYQLETLGDYYKQLKMIEGKNKMMIKLANACQHNNLYAFITVNPKPDIELAHFVKKIEKLVNRNIFTEYYYVYEQRGTSVKDIGKGFHCHILAKRNLNYKPCKVAVCVRNTCKLLVSNPKCNNLVNVQFCGENWAEDKKEYILGKKKGEGKDIKQDFDKIWREKNNLKGYYKDAKDS